MFIRSLSIIIVRTLLMSVIVAASFTFSIPEAAAKNCYRVVKAKSLYVRAKANKSSTILTSITGGTMVEKSGLPVCGIWWCKIDTGKHVGYVGSKYLDEVACP